MTLHDQETKRRTRAVWAMVQKRRNGIFVHTEARIEVTGEPEPAET